MRLRHVDMPSGQVLHFQCFACKQQRASREVIADLDGPSFEAYYCWQCVVGMPTYGMTPAQEEQWNLQRAVLAHEATG